MREAAGEDGRGAIKHPALWGPRRPIANAWPGLWSRDALMPPRLSAATTVKSMAREEEHAMPLTPDTAAFQKRLAALPLATYQAGETVLTAGSTTGRLLILKEGAVEVVKEGVQIANVTEPGAVLGELSVLLDKPHTADVRALETSQFHVADAAALLAQDPTALLYVAAILAQRLDGANRALIEVKHQLQAGQPHSVIGKTVEKLEGLLGANGASLVYADYPSPRENRGTRETAPASTRWGQP